MKKYAILMNVNQNQNIDNVKKKSNIGKAFKDLKKSRELNLKKM